MAGEVSDESTARIIRHGALLALGIQMVVVTAVIAAIGTGWTENR